MFQHVLDRLLARPALGVQAGVDHQPHRAEHLGLQAAEVVERRVLEAQLPRELLGV
jgi:hypothetical protein